MVLPLLERLGDKAYKETHQRNLVISALERKHHPSAWDIYHYLRQNRKPVALATVYRTLNLLSHLGLVTKLELCERLTRYELADRDKERGNHHHHLVCLRCGKVIDFKPGFSLKIDRLNRGVSSHYRFKVTNHELTIFGYCQKCQAH